jgi:DNA polymerase-3 subunit alpha
MDDAPTYELIARGDTVGVFQFEGEGMRRALTSVRPTAFADIVALGALYRPGPMDNIPSFAARKHGREKVELLHPAMEPILRETYGIIVYQEQVMQIARSLAGYSLGEADLLRRAMGKKIHAEMVAQKARFTEGAAANGIDAKTADAIFELVLKFANYGFNKSHAAAYGLVSYQTAWLKAHHPTEFYAASMAFDIDNTDRLAAFVDDARRFGVKVLPPCINASTADFSVEGDAVRYALAGLKSVGEKAMAAVVESRGQGFTSLSDFAARVDPKLLNKRQLESLIAAGCFDELDANRAGVHMLAEAILGAAQANAEQRSSSQAALFGDTVHSGLALIVPNASWPLAERMAQEKEAFGFYFSGHPVEAWRTVLDANGALTVAEVNELPSPPGGGRRGVVMAGLIAETRWRTAQKSDTRYMFVTLSDRSGQYQASCFDPEAIEAVEAAAAANTPVLVQAELQWRDGDDAPRIAIRGLTPLADMAKRTRSRLVVALDHAADAAELAEMVAPARGQGRCELVAEVMTSAGLARLHLGRAFGLDADLEAAIVRRFGGSSSATGQPPRLALVS